MNYDDMKARRDLFRRGFYGTNRSNDGSENEMNKQRECKSDRKYSTACFRHARPMREPARL